jgi:hypothetical protein
VVEHLKPEVLYAQEKAGTPVSDRAIRRLARRIAPATIRELALLSEADHLGRGGVTTSPEGGAWLLARALGSG